ncbi:hypothetical protein INT45_009579 [Circinella minor]|uniref:Uncharacterized protein n=1 Tax=Circinella minor TaxID=1195481 RepID=A0A8H7RPJ7_9FUNG|nr:hypothetical protein INT45_009579 [Circinella minor]
MAFYRDIFTGQANKRSNGTYEVDELDNDDDSVASSGSVVSPTNVRRSARLGRRHVPYMGEYVDDNDIINTNLDLAEFDDMNSEELASLVDLGEKDGDITSSR